MNVFICDLDPIKAAQDLADRHVVKMVVESAQLLSTACHIKGITFAGQYKLTHRHHPCVQALLSDDAYVRWVILHAQALSQEYTRRYGRIHRSDPVLRAASALLMSNVSGDGYDLERFPRAVFEDLRSLPTVEAYRGHLRRKYLELWRPGFARWKSPASRPDWL